MNIELYTTTGIISLDDLLRDLIIRFETSLDSRTQLSVAIYDLCKGQWRYQIPDSAENQEQLRNLCRNTLALENTYLKLSHDYVLARSQQDLEEENLQIARILQNFAF